MDPQPARHRELTVRSSLFHGEPVLRFGFYRIIDASVTVVSSGAVQVDAGCHD